MLEKIFPYLAQQVVEDYKITEGICLDIGSGSGNWGLEIADITDMVVFFLTSRKAGELLDIKLLDHLIIAPATLEIGHVYYSFAEHGCLK